MASAHFGKRGRRMAAAVAALLLLLPEWPEAHEIPADVTVRAFVTQREDRVSFLVRLPLSAMRDFEFPVREPGYLELDEALPLAADAARQWIGPYLTFYADGAPLSGLDLVASRVSVPGDRAFANFEGALAQILGPPLDENSELPPGQAMLDALFEAPAADPLARLTLDARLAHLALRTQTILSFILPDGTVRPFSYRGDPGPVRLDPRWWEAAAAFTVAGFRHILDGIDHLLFLLCLVLPVGRVRTLVAVVSSFTAAHSITLVASAFGLVPGALWFPVLIEALIALSIVYMAFENILGVGRTKRWRMAFAFGLVHGFGFSFALSQTLQFAGSHLLTSLVAFNLGVELGQLAVLAVMVPALTLAFKHLVPRTAGVIVLSALVAHTSWHWMLDRAAPLARVDFGAPTGADGEALVLRWVLLLAISAAAALALRFVFRRLGLAGENTDNGDGPSSHLR